MSITNDCRLVARLRQELHSRTTQETYKMAPADFSRQPILTLPRVATLILRGHKVSQQNALNKFFRELQQPELLLTGSAYCQARQKLKPDLFIHLNACLLEEFTFLSRADQTWQSWRGHRVLGADGSKLNLPDTPALRAAYSVVGNQHGTAGERVQGLALVLYDLLNDLGLSAHLGPLQHKPSVLLERLAGLTQVNDLLVLDRNFSDYLVLAWAVQNQRHLLLRCQRNAFGIVEEFWASAAVDRVVSLPCANRQRTRLAVRASGLPEQLTVRLLKFRLPTGETEVLLTTLLDQQTYPGEEFYRLYGWRWNQETYYDRIKNIFEVERFSGLSQLAIEQDFYGIIFLATLESALPKRNRK